MGCLPTFVSSPADLRAYLAADRVSRTDERGVLTLWWTDGSFIGSIRPWGVDAEGIALEDMEAIAGALDVVMAGAPEA
jgi:hypothetical protein